MATESDILFPVIMGGMDARLGITDYLKLTGITGMVQNLPFTNAVPLDQPNGDMGAVFLNQSISLYPDPLRFASRFNATYLTAIGDGNAGHVVNFPAIAGLQFLKHSSSQDLVTTAGVVNTIAMWCDGFHYYYSISWDANQVPVAVLTPPAILTNPVIVGTPTVGQTLSYTGGTVTGNPNPTITQNWQKDGSDIVGATGLTYVPISIDNGHAITVKEIATNSQGTAFRASSAVTIGGADVTAPTIASAQVANAAPSNIVLTASEALNAAFIPAVGSFTLSGGKTCINVAIVGSTITLTASAPYANGDTITASYNQPGSNQIRDAAGNLMNSFTNQAVTNNIAGAGDTTPPTLVSATVENATPTVINLVFNEAMTTSDSPAAAAFAVSAGHTISAFAWVDSTHANLTVDAFVNGEAARTLAYTQPGSNKLRDVAGNLLVNVSALSITNNVSAGSGTNVAVNFATLNAGTSGSVVKSGDSTAGFNYGNGTIGGVNFFGGSTLQVNNSNVKIPAGQDGEFIVHIGGNGATLSVATRLFINSTNTGHLVDAIYSMDCAGAFRSFRAAADGTVAPTATGGTPVANTTYNYKLKRVGSTWTWEYSSNNGTSWTVLDTQTGGYTGDAYPGISFLGPISSAANVRGNGVV